MNTANSIHAASNFYLRVCSDANKVFRLMNMLPAFLFLHVLLHACYFLNAQNLSGKPALSWWIQAGGGLNNSTSVDKSFSLLPFSGNAPGWAIAAGWHGPIADHQLSFYYSSGNMKTTSLVPSISRRRQTSLDYSLLYRPNMTNKHALTYKAGAGVNILYVTRAYSNFINNNTAFESSGSISGLFELSYRFPNLLPGLTISDRITIPLVSAVTQPAFGSPYLTEQGNNNGDNFKSFFKATRIVSFAQFARLSNTCNLQKEINENHAVSINYSFDYYIISGNRKVLASQQRLELFYKVNF